MITMRIPVTAKSLDPQKLYRFRLAIKYVNALKQAESERAWSTASDSDGYCVHGTYVGGCGVDWMCGACESGWSHYEIALGNAGDEMYRMRKEYVRKLQEAMFTPEAMVVLSKDERGEMIDHWIKLDKASR